MTTTIDDYISRVLAAMPASTPQRSQIAVELRGHIAERLEHGLSPDDVLRKLGDPVALAESYLAAVPLVSASFGKRFVAKLLDMLLVAAGVAAIAAWLALVTPRETRFMLPILAIIGGSLVFGAYTVVAEYFWGATVGKRALNLRVVRESGTRISLGQSFVRQLPMFLQIYWIDVLFAAFTERSQRAFEVLSKTRVVAYAESAITERVTPGQAEPLEGK